MTQSDPVVAHEPPADIAPASVLDALLRAGRWADAAAYAKHVDDVEPPAYAALLLVAGRLGEAQAILGPLEAADDEASVRFLRHLAAVLAGEADRLPSLIAEAEGFSHYLGPLLMLRAADAAGAGDVAGHYAAQVLRIFPGEPDATRAAAVDLIARGEYIEAIRVIDRSESARAVDESSALTEVLERLRDDEAAASALVTIGRYMHRPKDPTVPLDKAARDRRERWRTAHQRFGRTHWNHRLAWLGTAVAAIVSFVLLKTALPGIALAVCTGAWLRTRPLPGLDLRTSQVVRALSDPRTIILSRRYRPLDVLTFIFVGVVLGGFAARLPHGPSWLGGLEVVGVLLLAAGATRGRRRWIRRERERLLPQPLSPGACRCLDLGGVSGVDGRDYVQKHLFRIGTVPHRHDWSALQCFETHVTFVHLPAAQLTLRLALAPTAEPPHR